MSLITDPDDLNQGTEVIIDTSALTVQLVVAGNMTLEGVTGQALYSFLIEEWKNDNALIPFPFPMFAVFAEEFEFVDDWTLADLTSVNLVKTSGFAYRNSAGNIVEMCSGVITLGTVGGTDQIYHNSDGTATDFSQPGAVNEVLSVLSDPNGDGDYADGYDRRGALKLFLRVQGKTYDDVDLTDIGITQLDYRAYRFPLSNDTDGKVTQPDVVVDLYGVTVGFYATPQPVSIDGTDYDFGVIVQGNSRTAEEIYMAVQSLLRKATDINSEANPIVGKLAPALMAFIGDDLGTFFVDNPFGGGGGVFINGLQTGDLSRVTFQDNTNTTRQITQPKLIVFNNLDNYNIQIVDENSVIQDDAFNQTGTYQFEIPEIETGTWRYIVYATGFQYLIGEFDAEDLLTTVDATLTPFTGTPEDPGAVKLETIPPQSLKLEITVTP